MGGYRDADVPIIVRGDGCYLEDVHGTRYLDALAGLFSVNIGYSFGEEIGQAALAQMRELPFYTNWSYSHPRAIELAEEVASLAPGDLNRVFFVSGGSEAVESAWKLARQFHVARGAEVGTRYKAIARHVAYHGTTLGALALTGVPAIREPFQPLVPEVRHVSNTNRYHRPPEETEEEFTAFLLDELEQTILDMGPDTVCLVHMEPVQNAGGTFVGPAGYWQGVRELCTKYGILLSADEVITGFGRVGHWFASERYDIRPDIVTCAKGLSSSYAAIGAVVATDRVMEPFLADTSMFSHGITFGGHPVMCAIALKNIEIMKRERIVEGVLEHEAAFRSTLEQLLDLPIVGDVRGTGFFYAVELVKDSETRETLLARRARVAAARLPLRAAVRARAHLPRRRPRRSRDPDLAAARRAPARVRPHRRGARRDAGRGVGRAAALTVAPGLAAPWWLQDAPPDSEQPALDGDTTADVAIVGGGFTGLWTAHRAEAPRSCGRRRRARGGALRDRAERPERRLPPRLLVEPRALSRRARSRAARSRSRAQRTVRSRPCAPSSDDVWLREGGLLRVSTSHGSGRDPRPLARRAHASSASRRRRSRSRATSSHDAARRPPSAAASSFATARPSTRRGSSARSAREALAAGVRLYERTEASRIGDGLVESARGNVRASEVVVAMNAWASGWKPLSRLLTPFGSYVVLTEPVPELLAEIGWTGGEAITDCRMFLHYFRTTADGRVLMGSGSGPIGFRGRIDRRFSGDVPTVARAEAGLRLLLPGLAAAKVEHAWGGPIDVSADHLPVFGTVPGTRVHYGAGYTGNGVGPELARRPDPRVARAPCRRRVVAAAARQSQHPPACRRSR